MLLRIAKTALTAAGASLLAGCLPIPHHDTVSPAIDGTVHRNGQPVAGARIYVENPKWGPYETKPPAKECTFQGEPLAQSDANGAFRIPLRQRRGYFFIGEQMGGGPAWRLCIADGERRYEGWYEEAVMHREISLDCNLESAPQAWGWRAYHGRYKVAGVCRSRADEEKGDLTPLPPASGK